MTTSDLKPGEGVKDVRFDDDTMSVDLVDGRTITVPLVWYPAPAPRIHGAARTLGGVRRRLRYSLAGS